MSGPGSEEIQSGLFTRTRFCVVRESLITGTSSWVVPGLGEDSVYHGEPGLLVSEFCSGIAGELSAEEPYFSKGAAGVEWGLYQDLGEHRFWHFSIVKEGLESAIKPIRNDLASQAIGVLSGQISHDIYNFMTAVLGATSLLRRRIAQDDHRFGHVLQLESAIASAKRKFNSLSLWSGRESMSKDEVELVGELQGLVEKAESRHPKALFLNCFPETPIHGQLNRHALQYIVAALLDNGCEAANGESYVQVSLDQDDSCVRITVETQGAIISDEQLERAFLPTYSGWKRKRRGLGLTIALVQARRIGGNMHLRRTGKGVASTLELPLTAAGIESSRSTTSQRAPADRRGELMLVDADNTSRALLRTALESAGWRVHEASYGAASLALMRALPRKPELLLCDLSLTSSIQEPWIRSLLEMQGEVRILFFVADAGDVQETADATGVGIESILPKPFSPADLIDFIDP